MKLIFDDAPGLSREEIMNRSLDTMVDMIDLTQALAAAHDMDTIMDIVRHGARDLTRADGATFVLREGDHCFYADEDAIQPLWKGSRFLMSDCVSG